MNNKLYMVIPCYNEEEVLPETSKRLREKINSLIEKGKIDKESRIVFVNDGSKDKTWEIIKTLHEEDPVFSGINLTRNSICSLLMSVPLFLTFCSRCNNWSDFITMD